MYSDMAAPIILRLVFICILHRKRETPKFQADLRGGPNMRDRP
jgi:hypothetical protein